jgi:hypothetical protein
VLFRELPRFLVGVDWASVAYGVLRLVSEFWRPSVGKSSPKKFGSRLWKPLLDLDPVLLTVVWLASDGRRLSLSGKPMLSSRLPVPGRAKPGDSWARSSLESLYKLLQALFAATGVPLLPADQGAVLDEALVAVGGFRDIDGTRPPVVSSTASCFRWSLKLVCGASQLGGLRGRCAGSFGGGAGGTVPGEMSLSFSLLHHGVSRVSAAGGWRCSATCPTAGAQPQLGALPTPSSSHMRRKHGCAQGAQEGYTYGFMSLVVRTVTGVPRREPWRP